MPTADDESRKAEVDQDEWLGAAAGSARIVSRRR